MKKRKPYIIKTKEEIEQLLMEKILNETTRSLGRIMQYAPEIRQFLETNTSIKTDSAMEMIYNWWNQNTNDICPRCNEKMHFTNLSTGYMCNQTCEIRNKKSNVFIEGYQNGPKMETEVLLNKIYDLDQRRDRIPILLTVSYAHLGIELISQTKFLPETSSFSERIHCLEESISEVPKCPSCDNLAKYNTRRNEYRPCSRTCSQSLDETNNKRMQTSNNKWGIGNYQNHKQTTETLRNKTQDEWDEINRRIRVTKFERYGDENYRNNEKRQQTCLERYGDKNSFGCPNVQRRAKETVTRNNGGIGFNSKLISDKCATTRLEKYGTTNLMEVPSIKKKIVNTLIDRYNVTNAYHLAKRSPFASKVSQDVFQMIYDNLPADRKQFCQFRDLNSEYIVKPKDARKPRSFDFVMLDTKKCIEFNGDFWHMNPTQYTEDAINNVVKKTAKEIWDHDKCKLQLIESMGFEVLVIWENDWYQTPDDVLQRCFEFILV